MIPSRTSSLFWCLAGWCLLSRWMVASAEPPIVTSITEDLDFDENQKLDSHYIVFPANRPDCPTHKWATGDDTPGHGFHARALEGEALQTVFPHYGTGKSYLNRGDPKTEVELKDGESDPRCLAACLEVGTDISVAGHTMPHFHYASNSADFETDFGQKSNFDHWFHSACSRVEVCFINYAVKERPLEIFWVSQTGKRQKQMDLPYSERKTHCFISYVGHIFEAVDRESGFYERVAIEHTSTRAFGTAPPSSSQRFDGIDEIESSVRGALTHEWQKHLGVERSFSSLGFAKGKLPDDVFANMGAFYYNNQDLVVNEEWTGKGFFVNWWETDVKFVAIPWELKKKWQLRLMELVSAWSGVEVEETSMYGLRQYERGARLLSHVDRLPTHAVSLIVNIAQHNLANPWPIEVFDHGDRLHEITMEPGEIVYYESAKNLHSRNRPLTCKPGGCAFVNLFTHYRPVHDGSNWFNNMADMPNRPPPLKQGQVAYDESDESCKRQESNANTSDSRGMDNFLGVGKVECDDQRLGPYISPTLFKARSAEDIFLWWKSSADANLIGFDENRQPVYQDANTGEVYHEMRVPEPQKTQFKDDDEHHDDVYDGYDGVDDDDYNGDDDDFVPEGGSDEL